jgi:uncharacterized protein YndB with AHSA1/START domain
MSTSDAIPPLVVEFRVAAAPTHAFDTWVRRPERWWPAGHTVSGSPAAIVFEPRAGGRIYERAADGVEHDWGEVLDWEPPGRLRYLWHLFFTPAEATEIELTFERAGRGTLVRLVQTGWDALGDEGRPRRERTVKGWNAVTGGYRQLCELEGSSDDREDQ